MGVRDQPGAAHAAERERLAGRRYRESAVAGGRVDDREGVRRVDRGDQPQPRPTEGEVRGVGIEPGRLGRRGGRVMGRDPAVERGVRALAAPVAPCAGREVDPRARERAPEGDGVDPQHREPDERGGRRAVDGRVARGARAPRRRPGSLDRRAPRLHPERSVDRGRGHEAARSGELDVERALGRQLVRRDSREAAREPRRLGGLERALESARPDGHFPYDEPRDARGDGQHRQHEPSPPARARVASELDVDLPAALLGRFAGLAPDLLVLGVPPLEHRHRSLDLGEPDSRLRGRLRRALAAAQVDSPRIVMTAIDRHPTALLPHAALLAACAGLAIAGCAGSPRVAGTTGSSASPAAAAPGRASGGGSDVVRSNVARADYAGSAACAPCHADVAAAWERSPMHRMTRDARGAEIRAPFDGDTLRFKDDTVVLERRGEDRFVRVERPGNSKTYRVTRVIGGRTREDFAGVEVGGHGEEVVLPVSYVLGTGTLRYKGYSVMVHERTTVRAGPIWSRSCIFCHNTVPEMDRLVGAIAGAGAPAYQGEQVDRWLPADRRAHVRVTDEGAFATAASAEIARLGGVAPGPGDGAPSVARRAIDVVRSGFDGGALVEVGIGCEACHGGAREHARDPRVRPSLSRPSRRLARRPRPCRRARRPRRASRPSTGPAPAATRCSSRATRSRGREAAATPPPAGATSTRARPATSCSAAARARWRARLPRPARGRARAGSSAPSRPRRGTRPAPHATASSPTAGACSAHAHHDPDGAGGSCVACHMPRKNMGLDGTLTRYHRIGSPTDPARVLGDRPLECALCHADRTVGSLVDAMERWWPVRYPRQRLQELYGSLDANVMRATLELGKPHEQAVAMATLGAARDRAAVPLARAAAPRGLPARAGVGEARAHRDPGPMRRRPRGGRRVDRAGGRLVRRSQPERDRRPARPRQQRRRRPRGLKLADPPGRARASRLCPRLANACSSCTRKSPSSSPRWRT